MKVSTILGVGIVETTEDLTNASGNISPFTGSLLPTGESTRIGVNLIEPNDRGKSWISRHKDIPPEGKSLPYFWPSDVEIVK